MLQASGVTIQFGQRELFENVNVLFSPGNCYGIIGANGSGKSTFLKILSGEIEPNRGEISHPGDARISVLKQDQFAFDEYTVMDTVIMGYKKLYETMKERDAIYSKPDYGEEDGIRASELEAEFSEMDGWNAEPEAGKLLDNVGIPASLHQAEMKTLEANQKLRVLLAQALFGNPDILLLDEPTNQLDVETCMWLEDFLYDFKNTAIVVSHDRHFLDRVCTHIADIDYGKVQLYTGNYSFWLQSSELALQQRGDKNKKVEEKRKELQEFIARFSANASKSRQATARKKLLEKLTLEDIRPSNRKYPYVDFQPERDLGNEILEVTNLSLTLDEELLFKDLSFRVEKGDKIAFLSRNDKTITALLQVLNKEMDADSGQFKWGVSTSQAYFPKDHKSFFESESILIDWLRQFSKDTDESFVRGFLGRMLFSGEEVFKKVNVLSGGEKVRCMLSRMMLMNANCLTFDEPTDHLDLESITSLNRGLESFKGIILFSSRDHEFVQTVANRIIEITPQGFIDEKGTNLDEYFSDSRIQQRRKELYGTEASQSLSSL